MITKFTIFGERCTGTNYLQYLIQQNFEIEITWKYGWKHFFGFNELKNSDDTLFIGIVRNPYDWMNSLFREQHHLPEKFKNINNFLNDEIYSLYDKNDENNIHKNDINIYTKEKYKNIFELRNTKLKFLIEDMPSLVKNYLVIRYEDLLDDFENTMNKIKEKGLIIKNNITFPSNIIYYTSYCGIIKDTKFSKNNKKKKYISNDLIENKLYTFYEIKLNYLQ